MNKDIRSELIGLMIKRNSLIPDTKSIQGFKDPMSGPLSEAFKVIVDLYDSKEAVSASKVIRGVCKTTGQPEALHTDIIYSCMEIAKNTGKFKGYVEEIRNSLIAGRIRDTVSCIMATEGREHADADDMMERLESSVRELRASIAETGNGDNQEADEDILGEIQKYKESGDIPLLKTGLWEYDRMTGGFGNGEYITISGLEGSGKSALATTMMLYMSKPISAVDGKATIMGDLTTFISLEMSKVDLNKRLYHQVIGFDMRKAFATKMDPVELEIEVIKAQARLRQFNIDIIAPRSNHCTAIKNMCRTAAANGSKAIFIDYFQLITAGFKEQTRDLERVSDEFRRLALELDIPIIMLSQQNEEARKRTSANGNTYGGVSRGNVMYCKKLARDVHTCILIDEGMDKLIVDKSRTGGTGELPVKFNVNNRLLYTGRRADTDTIQM